MPSLAQTFIPAGTDEGPTRAIRNFLIAAAVILVCWTAIWQARPSFVVDGTIRAVTSRTYPWNPGQRFDLAIDIGGSRPVVFPSLRGACAMQSLGAACAKPEFPIGAPIRVEASGFLDPNTCGKTPLALQCLRGRGYRGTAYVSAVSVGGRPVAGGWGGNFSAAIIYLYIAGVVALLARHDWRVSQISVRMLIFLAVMAPAALLGGATRYL